MSVAARRRALLESLTPSSWSNLSAFALSPSGRGGGNAWPSGIRAGKRCAFLPSGELGSDVRRVPVL
jgi:hypothetical protein